MRVRRDEHALDHALHERADALIGRLRGDDLLVASRGAVAEANWTEPGDVDRGLLDERREPCAALRRVLLEEPGLPVGRLVTIREERAFGVSPDEDRRHRQAVDESERRLGLRPPGQVTAEDDEVGGDLLELGQDRLERDGVPMDVGEDGNSIGVHAFAAPDRRLDNGPDDTKGVSGRADVGLGSPDHLARARAVRRRERRAALAAEHAGRP
jgi:hypothetical protein